MRQLSLRITCISVRIPEGNTTPPVPVTTSSKTMPSELASHYRASLYKSLTASIASTPSESTAEGSTVIRLVPGLNLNIAIYLYSFFHLTIS